MRSLNNEDISKQKALTGVSLFMWWFPVEIQDSIEWLFATKPVETNLGGLLGLWWIIGFNYVLVGINFNENSFFENKKIDKLRRSSSTQL
jgi:hypothetical protein